LLEAAAERRIAQMSESERAQMEAVQRERDQRMSRAAFLKKALGLEDE
jgi:hypothetical protein